MSKFLDRLVATGTHEMRAAREPARMNIVTDTAVMLGQQRRFRFEVKVGVTGWSVDEPGAVAAAMKTAKKALSEDLYGWVAGKLFTAQTAILNGDERDAANMIAELIEELRP